jgi:hypothetical protein
VSEGISVAYDECDSHNMHSLVGAVLMSGLMFKLNRPICKIRDSWQAGVRFSSMPSFFFSSQRPDRIWGPLGSLSNGYRGLLPLG